MDSSLKRRLSEMESSSKRTRLDEGVNERLETDKVMVGSRKSPVRFFFYYREVFLSKCQYFRFRASKHCHGCIAIYLLIFIESLAENFTCWCF